LGIRAKDFFSIILEVLKVGQVYRNSPQNIIIRILSSSHPPRWYAPSSAFSELIALKSIGEKVEKGIGEAGSLARSSPFLTCIKRPDRDSNPGRKLDRLS